MFSKGKVTVKLLETLIGLIGSLVSGIIMKLIFKGTGTKDSDELAKLIDTKNKEEKHG